MLSINDAWRRFWAKLPGVSKFGESAPDKWEPHDPVPTIQEYQWGADAQSDAHPKMYTPLDTDGDQPTNWLGTDWLVQALVETAVTGTTAVSIGGAATNQIVRYSIYNATAGALVFYIGNSGKTKVYEAVDVAAGKTAWSEWFPLGQDLYGWWSGAAAASYVHKQRKYYGYRGTRGGFTGA